MFAVGSLHAGVAPRDVAGAARVTVVIHIVSRVAPVAQTGLNVLLRAEGDVRELADVSGLLEWERGGHFNLLSVDFRAMLTRNTVYRKIVKGNGTVSTVVPELTLSVALVALLVIILEAIANGTVGTRHGVGIERSARVNELLNIALRPHADTIFESHVVSAGSAFSVVNDYFTTLPVSVRGTADATHAETFGTINTGILVVNKAVEGFTDLTDVSIVALKRLAVRNVGVEALRTVRQVLENECTCTVCAVVSGVALEAVWHDVALSTPAKLVVKVEAFLAVLTDPSVHVVFV